MIMFSRLYYNSSNGSSTSASPGPLKRFRQTYASEMRLEPSLASSVPPNHFTQDWVQNYHCPSYSSQSHSNVFF